MRTYHLYCCLLFKENITDYRFAYISYVFITSFCARLSDGCTLRGTETTKWLSVFSACFPQLGIKHTFMHSRIIICFGQFLWKCYYLERMLEDNDGPQLLSESPVHNLRPGERVVSARSISYQLGKLLYALTSTLLCVGNDSWLNWICCFHVALVLCSSCFAFCNSRKRVVLRDDLGLCLTIFARNIP